MFNLVSLVFIKTPGYPASYSISIFSYMKVEMGNYQKIMPAISQIVKCKIYLNLEKNIDA